MCLWGDGKKGPFLVILATIDGNTLLYRRWEKKANVFTGIKKNAKKIKYS